MLPGTRSRCAYIANAARRRNRRVPSCSINDLRSIADQQAIRSQARFFPVPTVLDSWLRHSGLFTRTVRRSSRSESLCEIQYSGISWHAALLWRIAHFCCPNFVRAKGAGNFHFPAPDDPLGAVDFKCLQPDRWTRWSLRGIGSVLDRGGICSLAV